MADGAQSSFREKILEWSQCNLRRFPWRETSQPYEVLIAEILLQRTRAESVEPVYNEILRRYPNAESLFEAEHGDLFELITPLGLQNKRVKSLKAIADKISNCGFPETKEELLDLPYVGQYAVNSTLCFAFGQTRPIVDANVVRVYERAFGRELNYEEESTWKFAKQMLPSSNAQEYNLALLDFAAKICRPRNPDCDNCFFSDECTYFNNLKNA